MGNTLLAGSSRASVMPGLECTGTSGALLSHSPTGDTENQLVVHKLPRPEKAHHSHFLLAKRPSKPMGSLKYVCDDSEV